MPSADPPRSDDDTLRAAERAWRASPADPAAAEHFLALSERASVLPPLELLEERVLPAREVELPREDVAGVWVKPAAMRQVLLLGQDEGSHLPPRVPPPGPTPLPPRTRLGFRLPKLPPDRLGRAISGALALAAGERLKLSVDWEADLAPVVLAPGLAGRTFVALEVHVAECALDLSRLRVGAFKTARLARPEALPIIDWGLELDRPGALTLEQIAGRVPNLRVLEASLERIEETALLARWPGLERLRLSSELWQEAEGARLAGLSRLRTLRLDFHHLSRGFLAALAEGPARLDRLGLLASGAIERRDRKLYREVGLLGSLRWLSVDDLDSTSVQGWERLERLETLVLSCSPPISLNPVAWRTLAGLPRLRTLATDSSGLGDFSIGVLARCPTLETLDLRHEYTLTDAGLRALEGHPRLKHVSLTDTRATQAGKARLQASLGPGACVAP